MANSEEHFHTAQMRWTFDPDRPEYIVEHPGYLGNQRKREAVDATYARAYLWARTILCDDCTGLIPLSPQWWMTPSEALELATELDFKVPLFSIVPRKQESNPTVRKGIAICPHYGTTTQKGYSRKLAAEWYDRRQPDDAVAIHNNGPLGHPIYAAAGLQLWPIYRAGKRPKQGRQKFYRIPGGIETAGRRERERLMRYHGLENMLRKERPRYPVPPDPLAEMGIDPDDPDSEYAPEMAYWHGWPDKVLHAEALHGEFAK